MGHDQGLKPQHTPFRMDPWRIGQIRCDHEILCNSYRPRGLDHSQWRKIRTFHQNGSLGLISHEHNLKP